MYRVYYTTSASKNWKKVPTSHAPPLRRAIENLADNARPLNAEKLAGSRNAYRLRKGDYRVLYTIDDIAKSIVIYKISHRREAYR